MKVRCHPSPIQLQPSSKTPNHHRTPSPHGLDQGHEHAQLHWLCLMGMVSTSGRSLTTIMGIMSTKAAFLSIETRAWALRFDSMERGQQRFCPDSPCPAAGRSVGSPHPLRLKFLKRNFPVLYIPLALSVFGLCVAGLRKWRLWGVLTLSRLQEASERASKRLRFGEVSKTLGFWVKYAVAAP